MTDEAKDKAAAPATRRYLLILKESMGDDFALAEVRKRLGESVRVEVAGDSYKIRQYQEIALIVETESNDKRIWEWFAETNTPAPYASGTLLYFSELIRRTN